MAANAPRQCKKCGTPFGSRTAGCQSCYMREVYYKKPENRAKRAEFCARRYARRQADPEIRKADLDAAREYQRTHRAENPDKQRAYSKKYRGKLYAIIESYKDRPCAHCDREFPPCAMDLHHRDPAQKTFNLSQFATTCYSAPGMSREEVLRAELAKCDVVCATCHRIHHGATV